jgi:hypothetical protein
MKLGGTGGANTSTGLKFEQKTSLADLLNQLQGYSLRTLVQDQGFRPPAMSISVKGQEVGLLLGKEALYRFMTRKGARWDTILSKKILPDEAVLVGSARLVILEKKFQQTPGSVDEKLQTCHYKIRQFRKLAALFGVADVRYYYVLSRWFENPSYRDVLEYVREVGCDYFFEELPFEALGLPSP